jgi:hypothetical protein
MISRWLKRKSRNNTKKCISVNVAWYDKEEQRSMQLKSFFGMKILLSLPDNMFDQSNSIGRMKRNKGTDKN